MASSHRIRKLLIGLLAFLAIVVLLVLLVKTIQDRRREALLDRERPSATLVRNTDNSAGSTSAGGSSGQSSSGEQSDGSSNQDLSNGQPDEENSGEENSAEEADDQELAEPSAPRIVTQSISPQSAGPGENRHYSATIEGGPWASPTQSVNITVAGPDNFFREFNWSFATQPGQDSFHAGGWIGSQTTLGTYTYTTTVTNTNGQTTSAEGTFVVQ